MATPTERLVIEAAREYVARLTAGGDLNDNQDLFNAVDALDTEEAPNGIREQMITWGQVVTTDEVLSKNGRWYEVLSTETNTSGITTVRFVGLVNPFTKPAGEEVKVRRSDMGKAADLFATIMRSGPA